ncbi:MAG: hypothetical protein WCO63_08040 [Bacteroidota bacterium]
MKKLSILFITLIALAGCTKHETNQVDKLGCKNPSSLNYDASATIDDGSCVATGPKQYGFVLEYTATWCGPCGQWGAPAVHDLYAMGDVVAVACHVDGDPMYNVSLYNQLTSCRSTGGGIPAFWVGDEKMPNSPGQFPGKMTTLMGRDPDVSTVCKATRSGANVTIKSSTEFMKNCDGDYYLSFFITESEIPGDANAGAYAQTTPADPATYTHKFVLRSALNDKAYGEKISSGAVLAGKKLDSSYSMPIDATWTNELSVCTVIWKYNATSQLYEYQNAFESKF